MEAFIDTLLGRLLATSVQTVLLTAVVWTLCRCVSRLPPATQCWLWWLVALQAIIGLAAAPIPLPWLPPVQQLPALAPLTMQWNAIAAGSVSMPPAVDAVDAAGAARPWSLFLLWTGGIAAMCCMTLRDWRRGRQLLRHSTCCTDEPLLQALVRAAAARRLRRAPRLRLSRDIDSPLVIGHLRPVLLLPTRVAMSSEELEMVLAHELMHLRRGDLWWGCVPALARHLFFFHPCAHLAVREYGLAREADCDAAVVAVDRHSRRDYGRLLLRLGTDAGAGAALAVGSSTFHALNRRLTLLQNTTFLPRAGSIALLCVVAAIGVLPLRLVAAATTPATPAASAVVPAPVAAPDSPGPRPERKRKKELLEAFALETLQMVGLMRIEGQSGGLVRAPDGLVHRVLPGNYLGQNEGRVTRIEPTRISITETVPDGRGGLMQRTAWLGLDVPAAAVRAAPVAAAIAATPAAAASRTTSQEAVARKLVLSSSEGEELQRKRAQLQALEAAIRQALALQADMQAAKASAETSAAPTDEQARLLELEKALRQSTERVKQLLPERVNLWAQQARPVPAPPVPRDAPVHTGEKMTASFQDIPTRRLLQLIGEASGRNMLIDDAVTGTTTLRVDNQPWDEVLDIVLRSKGLDKRVQGNVIIIGPAEKLAAMEQAELARKRAQDAGAQSPTR